MSRNTNAAVVLAASVMSAVGLLTIAASAQATPAFPLDPPCNVLIGDYCAGTQSQPLQGPTATANPGIAGVTFHVTDRSGVASQCTYSSEGYTDGFALPAKASVDVFVPAVRLLKNRTGTISCDNGTSTNTSVFF